MQIQRSKQNQQLSLCFRRKSKKIASLTCCCLRCTEQKEKKMIKQTKQSSEKNQYRVTAKIETLYTKTIQIHTVKLGSEWRVFNVEKGNRKCREREREWTGAEVGR